MRLIDADKVIEQFRQYRLVPAPKTKGEKAIRDIFTDAIYRQAEIVKNAPTVEAEPIKHGHWIVISEYPKKAECSYCGYPIEHELVCWWDYCPNCSAKMDLTE